MSVDIDIVLPFVGSTVVEVEVVKPEIVVGAVGPIEVTVETAGSRGEKGEKGDKGDKGDPGSAGLTVEDTNALYVNVTGDAMTGPLRVYNTDITGHTSGGSNNDALKFVSNNAGAAIAVQNARADGYAGIEYIDQTGAVKVFTGYNNGSAGEFRFNNISGPAANIRFKTNGTDRLVITEAGVAVTTDPAVPMGVVTKQYADNLIAVHQGSVDPHPIYLTTAEGTAAFAPISHGHVLGDLPSTLATDAEVTTAISTHDGLTTAHTNLRGTATPVSSNTGASVIGTATKFSREDHKHQVLVDVPVALGSANAQGSSTNLSRSDHVHIYPTAANVNAVALTGNEVVAGIKTFSSVVNTSAGINSAGIVNLYAPAAGQRIAFGDSAGLTSGRPNIRVGGDGQGFIVINSGTGGDNSLYFNLDNLTAPVSMANALINIAGAPTNRARLQSNPLALGTVGSYKLDNWNTQSFQVPLASFVNVSNGGATPTAYLPALVLGRDGVGGASYNNTVEFKVGRYIHSGTFQKTGMTIALGDGNGEAAGVDVLELRGDKSVLLKADPTVPFGAVTKQYADGLITAHTGLADPHPIYLTQTEGNTLYASIAHTHPSTTDHVWVFDIDSTMADPGPGELRTNTTAGTPATQIAFSAMGTGGADVGNIMRSLTTGDVIYFQQANNSANWGRYEITGPPTDNGTWFLAPTLGIGTSGGTIAKGQDVLIRFTYGGGGGSGSLGGLTQEAADGLYVNSIGDTMTGELGLEQGGWSPKVPTDIYHLTNKQYVDARTPKITAGTTAPSNPAVNDIWVDTN